MAPAECADLPIGVEQLSVTRYRVGIYTYDSLSDAMAQYRRTQPYRSAKASN